MKSRWLIACGQFFFRFRNGVFPLLIVLAILMDNPRRFAGSAAVDNAVDALGVLIALTGQALRVAAIGYKYIKRGGRDKKAYAEELVTGGFFAHCRNPLYTGNIMMGVGLLVVVSDPWLLAIGVPLVCFLYTAIVAAEENFLAAKFGAAYDEYCRRVNRWVPNVRGIGASLRDIPFSWSRVLAKEYGTTTGLLALLIIARAYTVWGRDGAQHARVYAWGAVPLLIAYGYARWLKKSGRLVDLHPENVDAAPRPSGAAPTASPGQNR